MSSRGVLRKISLCRLRSHEKKIKLRLRKISRHRFISYNKTILRKISLCRLRSREKKIKLVLRRSK